jgi:Helix-turn-helix domain
MNIRKRRLDRSGRVRLFSPGRPPVAGREERWRFWAAIAAGTASEEAAVSVPQAVRTRWFRKAGGMPPSMFGLSAKPLSGRYLSFVEREEIALLRLQGYSTQEVARRLRRVASTISRELRRNAATRSGGLEYRATTAQWHAERAARRERVSSHRIRTRRKRGNPLSDCRIVMHGGPWVVGGRACDPHQPASFCDAEARGPTMTGVFGRVPKPFQRRDPGLVLGEQIGRVRVFVKGAGFVFLNPDPDQIATHVMALGESMQSIAGQEFLSDLTLEFDAARAGA